MKKPASAGGLLARTITDAPEAALDDLDLIGSRRARPALRRRRLELGATLEEVAAAAGMSVSHLARLETGAGVTPGFKAEAIALDLLAPLDELFSEPLLARSDVARFKDCHAETVAKAVREGELRLDGNRVPLGVALGWTPRPRGGQRRLNERTCDYRECGRPFQPRKATQRFCSNSNCEDYEREARKRDKLAHAYEGARIEAERADAASRQLSALMPRWDALRVAHATATAQLAAYCQQRKDLWTVQQAADWVPVAKPVVDRLIRVGSIPVAEVRDFGTGNVRLVRIIDVKKFFRSRPHFARDWLKWALTRGYTLEHARAIADAAEQRQANARHSRAGNPRAKKARPLHERWAAMLAALDDDGFPYGYDYAAEPEPRPCTRQEALRQVVLEDWQDHPDAWPRNKWPADPLDADCLDARMERAACARVDIALKRLQIA